MELNNDLSGAENADKETSEISAEQLDEVNGGWIKWVAAGVAVAASGAVGVYRGFKSGK